MTQEEKEKSSGKECVRRRSATRGTAAVSSKERFRGRSAAAEILSASAW